MSGRMIMENSLPKVLVISRGVWSDTDGTSSTLTNIFEDYDPDKLAHIYIETKRPNTRCCHRFYQISEFTLVHKLIRWWLKPGHAFDTREGQESVVSETIASQESDVMGYVRGHRSRFYVYLREILWSLNGWKSKDLKRFVKDFNPDVVWLDSSPLPFMNRLYHYVLKAARKPASIFMQDDVFFVKSHGGTLLRRIRRSHIRSTVHRVVSMCSNMFVISPKMKREYDEIFGINSILVTKSAKVESESLTPVPPHNPLRLVYMGQVLYGRLETLITMAKAISDLNSDEVRFTLDIYTNNSISEEDRRRLLAGGNVFLKDPVPYQEVQNVIAGNDVVVFVETFDPQISKISRLSFSTKICDYLGSGKCILAAGPSDTASIEYLAEEDAAIVCGSEDSIRAGLERLTDPEVVSEYALKAHSCAVRNHDREKLNKIIYGKLIELSKTTVTW